MLQVHIITPERSLPPQEAVHVTMTTVDGEVGVRTGHAPLVAGLMDGFAMVRGSDGKETHLALKTGSALVLRDQVKLFVEGAVDAAAIVPEAVQKKIDALDKTEPKDDLGRERKADELKWLRLQLAVAQRRRA